MKILLYNMGYGTGLNGSMWQYVTQGWRYLWSPKKIINNIVSLIKVERADVVCLLEADGGSIRSQFESQLKNIANALQLPFYRSVNKYHPGSIWRHLPVFKKQQNGVLSNSDGKIQYHYLKNGMKKLVIEYKVRGVSIFVVHLGLTSKGLRKKQLNELTQIISRCKGEKIICGDFNIFDGLNEIDGFLKENDLSLVNEKPSFPSIKPKKHFDLFLVSKGINVKNSGMIESELSDHLPIWMEIS